MDDWSVSIAVEDKFVIFGLNKPNGMLPENNLLDGLKASFWPLRGTYLPILDLGGLNSLSTDVFNFVTEWVPEGTTVIVDRDQFDIISAWPKRLPKLTRVDRRDWSFHKVSLAHFADEHDQHNYQLHSEIAQTTDMVGTGPPTEEEWELACAYSDAYESFRTYEKFRDFHGPSLEGGRFRYSHGLGTEIIVGIRALRAQIRSFGRNSLMTQLALVPGAMNDIVAVPYHAKALYETSEARRDDALILARPGVLAERTNAIFSQELTEFGALLNDPSTSENELQRFFENHNTFFKILGYKSVYPKVILERDDGTSLQPDFMLEPFDREFWDILDIKKPDVQLIVGSRDRKDFSAQVHQLNAQLREYGAYFDEEKNRKRVADRYGIRAYKPRLIGVIGDTFDSSDKMQLQRLMTQYSDTRLMTFSQIQKMASSRLLI